MSKFVLDYIGNKYQETKKHIESYPNLEQYKTIIEPFGGSFGFSRVLWLKNKNLKFIICDIDSDLINFYNLIKSNSNEENNNLLNKWNSYMDSLKDGEFISREIIRNEKKNQEDPILRTMLYQMFASTQITKPKYKKNVDFSIFKNCDFLHVAFEDLDLTSYKNDETLIYLDPPYLEDNNWQYKAQSFSSIFNKLLTTIDNYNCMVVIRYNPILDHILNKYKYLEYEKLYSLSHKTTSHLLYYNVPIVKIFDEVE